MGEYYFINLFFFFIHSRMYLNGNNKVKVKSFEALMTKAYQYVTYCVWQAGPYLLGGASWEGVAHPGHGPASQPGHCQPPFPAFAVKRPIPMATSQARARGVAAQELHFSQQSSTEFGMLCILPSYDIHEMSSARVVGSRSLTQLYLTLL